MCATVAGDLIRYLRAMTRTRALPSLLVVLCLAACTEGSPELAPTATGYAPAPISASPSSAVTYQYAVLDLCTAADLAPLAALDLTVREKRNSLPPGFTEGEAEMCLHEMKTADGHIARLTLTAIVAESAAEAQREFEGAERDKMKPAGPVSGPWQQGVARTLDTTTGFKHTEYVTHILDGNLYLSVWLAVGGDSYTPAKELEPAVTKITETTFKTVAGAWR
jgi:hypothetical protein